MFTTNHWFEIVFAAYQSTLNFQGLLAANIYFLSHWSVGWMWLCQAWLESVRLDSRLLVGFKPVPHISSFSLDQWLPGTCSSHGGSLESKRVSRNIRCLLRSWPGTSTLVILAHISLTKTSYKAKYIIGWGEGRCPLPPLTEDTKRLYDKYVGVELHTGSSWSIGSNDSIYHIILKELSVLLKGLRIMTLGICSPRYKISAS